MNKTEFENLIRLLHEMQTDQKKILEELKKLNDPIKVSIDELVYKSRDTN